MAKAKKATTTKQALGLSKAATAVNAMLAAKPRAEATSLPSAPGVAIYKIMGKMFAILATRKSQFVVLKSDPHLIEMLKEQYEGIGHRTHLDKRYWLAVTLESDVPNREIKRLIDHSYALVCTTLTKKQQAELGAK